MDGRRIAEGLRSSNVLNASPGCWVNPRGRKRVRLMSRRNIGGDKGDKSEFNCTILTRDAVGRGAEFHTRIPIAPRKGAEGAWLEPAMTDAAAVIEFARESSATEFVHHSTKPRVNYAWRRGPLTPDILVVGRQCKAERESNGHLHATARPNRVRFLPRQSTRQGCAE